MQRRTRSSPSTSKPTYPILSDPEKKVATAYGVVDSRRQLAARWTFYIGPGGRILHLDPKVSPKTAGEDVVAQLERLKVPKTSRPK